MPGLSFSFFPAKKWEGRHSELSSHPYTASEGNPAIRRLPRWPYVDDPFHHGALDGNHQELSTLSTLVDVNAAKESFSLIEDIEKSA